MKKLLLLLAFALSVKADVPVPPAASVAETIAGTQQNKFVSPYTLAQSGLFTNGNVALYTNIQGTPISLALSNLDGSILFAPLATNVMGKTTNVVYSVGVGQVSLAQLPSAVVTNITATPITQNLLAWWQADTLSATNGQILTAWPPLVGTAQLTAGGSPVFTNAGVGGHAGIYFDGVSALFTNLGLIASNPSLATNITFAIAYKNATENPSGSQIVLALSAPAVAGFYFNAYNNGAGPSSIGMIDGLGGQLNGLYAGHCQDNVVVFHQVNNSTADVWLNGKVGCANSLGGPAWNTSGASIQGNLVLGAWRNFGAPFSGVVSELLIWTNQLSSGQVAAINDYMTTKYHRRCGELVLDGDSITRGDGVVTTTNALAYRLKDLLPNTDVNGVAVSGSSSGRQLTNMMFWGSSIHNESPGNVLMDWVSCVNDSTLTAAQIESNYVAKAKVAHYYGWKYVPTTPISSQATDANGLKVAVNSWLTNNWATYFDGITRLDLIPSLFTNGACSNSVLFKTDYTHPIDAAYALVAPVYAAAYSTAIATTNYGTFNGTMGMGKWQAYSTPGIGGINSYDSVVNLQFNGPTTLDPKIVAFGLQNPNGWDEPYMMFARPMGSTYGTWALVSFGNQRGTPGMLGFQDISSPGNFLGMGLDYNGLQIPLGENVRWTGANNITVGGPFIGSIGVNTAHGGLEINNGTNGVYTNLTALNIYGTFTGNGAGLTNLAASSLYSSTTNTLVVGALGVTNSTSASYLLTITAGTALVLKDANNNQFGAPVLGDTVPLKPGWKFSGTGITAQCYQFP